MKGWGLASAFRTLTILPFPGKESASPATALYWFVPVGFVLGALSYAVAWTAVALDLPLVGAACIVMLLAVLTRAFHLDGLADMADGFGGGWTKDRVLEIMKDSHSGAFGVVALVVVLLLKTTAISAVLEMEHYRLLWFLPIFSRLLVVLQTVANPYARKEGGTAARLVSDSHMGHAIVSAVWLIATIILFGATAWRTLLPVVAVGVVSTGVIAWKSRSRIGGITGDILGATVEVGETVMVVALAVLLRLSL